MIRCWNFGEKQLQEKLFSYESCRVSLTLTLENAEYTEMNAHYFNRQKE